jgi:hypothetical protein
MARKADSNSPTPKGGASKTKADAAARDATEGERKPVPATQGAPTEGGTVQGVPTGKLDQDHDGVAETPEVGQEHNASSARPVRQAPGQTDPSDPAFPSRDNPKEYADVENQRESALQRARREQQEQSPRGQQAQQQAKTFEDACEDLGKGVKKLCDAGMGGAEAGKLALELWKEINR